MTFIVTIQVRRDRRAHLLRVRMDEATHRYFGMKARVGVDAESGSVHTVTGTAANIHDINAAPSLLHGEETANGLCSMACCDATQQAKTDEHEEPCRCDIRHDRTIESRHSCEGRASYPNSKAPVGYKKTRYAAHNELGLRTLASCEKSWA